MAGRPSSSGHVRWGVEGGSARKGGSDGKGKGKGKGGSDGKGKGKSKGGRDDGDDMRREEEERQVRDAAARMLMCSACDQLLHRHDSMSCWTCVGVFCQDHVADHNCNCWQHKEKEKEQVNGTETMWVPPWPAAHRHADGTPKAIATRDALSGITAERRRERR